MASHKAALRTQIKTALAALTPAQVMTQSAAVLSHLLGLPSFANCRSASVFLPMERGGEVDTWPIVRELLSRGASVAIPRVTGREPEDMVMLRLEGLAQAEGLPRTKWGIPEPNADVAATMADVTGSSELTLLLVPGVAFDARCGRVGHGRGYYDAFISRQRGLERPAGAEVLVVGLALAPQIVDAVPMGEDDERLDMVVTPDGVLAYTSAADQAKAAELLANSKRQRGAGAGAAAAGQSAGGGAGAEAEAAAAAEEGEEGSEPDDDADDGEEAGGTALGLSAPQRVDLAPGKFKYACLRLTRRGAGGRGAPSALAVRSAPGQYHADVAEPQIRRFEASGFDAEPLGGGRCVRDDGARSVHVYGYSVGFGGGEGGPPGAGMRDHAEVAALIRQALPGYAVTFDAGGY